MDEAKDAVAAPVMTRVVIAGAIGNFMEFYDFILFGVFSPLLAKIFFPLNDETQSLLLTLATYGVAVVTRPLGAVVLGTYADRAGRKAGLTLTILIMAASTMAIGLLPGYATLGIASPILLVLARLAQGFSAGGEFGGATAFLSEHAPPRRRGFYAGWLQTGTFASAILASGLGMAVTHAPAGSDLADWGWRLPFLLGGLIAPLGFHIRRNLPETTAFRQARGRAAPPSVPRAVVGNSRSLLVMVGVVLPATVGSYIILIYLPTYAARQLGMAQDAGFLATMLASATAALLCPVAGALSDRLGRRRVMMVGMLVTLCAAWPLFALLATQREPVTLMLVQAALGVLLALFAGPMTALGSELFPTAARSTGLSIGYGISAALFGNFTPFFLASLIALTGNILVPAFYMAAAMVGGTLAVMCAPERTGASLLTGNADAAKGAVL